MVKSDMIGDLEVYWFVWDIWKWIEDELDYFGYIKVIVICEIRVVEYVK